MTLSYGDGSAPEGNDIQRFKAATLLFALTLIVSSLELGGHVAAAPQLGSAVSPSNATANAYEAAATAAFAADQSGAVGQSRQAIANKYRLVLVKGNVTSVPSPVTPAALTGPTPAGGTASAPLAATSCWSITWTIYIQDVFGFNLAGYFQRIDWCGDGTTITSVIQRVRWGETYAASWQFQGHIDNLESGGAGFPTYHAITQGQFAQCLAFCFDYQYPRIDMTVYPNGGVG